LPPAFAEVSHPFLISQAAVKQVTERDDANAAVAEPLAA